MVIFAFAVLYAIVNSISSIGDVGKGDFNTFALFVYTIVLLPNMIYQLIPLSVLIGVMTAMLSLVNYSEYAIIRTSGVSLKRITSILLMVGISFAIITFFIGVQQYSIFINQYSIFTVWTIAGHVSRALNPASFFL